LQSGNPSCKGRGANISRAFTISLIFIFREKFHAKIGFFAHISMQEVFVFVFFHEYSFTYGHEKAPLHPSGRSEASHLYTFKQNEFLYYLRASAM
jgi:hypothetical protein